MQKITHCPTDASGKLWKSTVWTRYGIDGAEHSQAEEYFRMHAAVRGRKKEEE